MYVSLISFHFFLFSSLHFSLINNTRIKWHMYIRTPKWKRKRDPQVETEKKETFVFQCKPYDRFPSFSLCSAFHHCRFKSDSFNANKHIYMLQKAEVNDDGIIKVDGKQKSRQMLNIYAFEKLKEQTKQGWKIVCSVCVYVCLCIKYNIYIYSMAPWVIVCIGFKYASITVGVCGPFFSNNSKWKTLNRRGLVKKRKEKRIFLMEPRQQPLHQKLLM